MTWHPLPESDLHDLLNASWQRMNIPQRRLWEAVRITPAKWKQSPYGDVGGGFWVVGIMGHTVVWYNDIEDGFNCSTSTAYGTIGEYWCNQDQLEWTIQHILDTLFESRLTPEERADDEAQRAT